MRLSPKRPAVVFRFGLPFLAVLLVAAKPLVDAMSERSREIVVSPGVMWTGLAFALGAVWLSSRRTITWAQVAIITSCIGLAICGVASYWIGANLVDVSLEVSRVIVGFVPGLLLLGGLQKGTLTKFRRYLVLFAMAVALHSVIALMQYAGVVPSTYFQHGEARPSGLYFHPVSYGILLNVALLLVVIAHLRGWLKPLKVGGILIALLSLIVISSHRTSLAVAAVIILGWGLIRVLSSGRRVSVNLRVVALGFLLMALIGLIATLGIRSLEVSVARAATNVVGVLSINDFDPTSEGFLRGRGGRWERAVSAIQAGTMAERLVGRGSQVVDPHTDFLRAPLVHGSIGTFLLLLGIAALVGGFARESDVIGRRLIALVTIISIIYALTTKPTSYPFYMWSMSVVIWLVASSSARRNGGVDGVS